MSLRIFFFFWWFFSPKKMIWIAGILPPQLFSGVFCFVNFVTIAKANNCRFVTENQEHCIYSQIFHSGPKSWRDVGITEMLDNIFFTTSVRRQAIDFIGVLKCTNSGHISGRHIENGDPHKKELFCKWNPNVTWNLTLWEISAFWQWLSFLKGWGHQRQMNQNKDWD